MLTVIVQKLLNQIHMGHKHTPAAVSDQEQGIQGIPVSNNNTNIIPRTPVNLLVQKNTNPVPENPNFNLKGLHQLHQHIHAKDNSPCDFSNIPLRVVSLEQVQVCVPLVANHLRRHNRLPSITDIAKICKP